MSLLTGKLNDTVTYWAPNGVDSAGDITYSSPTQISGRWDISKELFIDKNGQERRSNSVVFLGQDVDEDGYLFLGTSSANDPTQLANAYEIQGFKKDATLEGNEYVRRAML